MKKAIYLFAALLFGVLSCTSDPDQKKDIGDTTDSEMDSTMNAEPKHEIVYSMPSPNEQYNLLYSLDGSLDAELTHDLSKADDYATTYKMAANFGVYVSDAAYLMKYEQGKSVFLDYVSTLDKLGEKIGITKVYEKELIKKVESVEGNTEKLFEISSENYLTIYDQLIENENGAELGVILSGAWIETMHILFHTAGDFEEDIDIQENIVDQKNVLKNLQGFLSNYSESENVSKMMEELKKIEGAYNNLDCKETSLKMEKEGETMVLNGGSSCLFTEDSYSDMKELIDSIRTSIIS